MIGFSGLGLLLVLFMKEVPMSESADDKFGLDNSSNDTVVQLTNLGSRDSGLVLENKPDTSVKITTAV